MSEKQAKALNILQNCLPEINPLCVCAPCFIRILLLSMAICCCVFGKIETCLRCTRGWKNKNTVMNNAFFANNLTVENRFQFRVYRFLFSLCPSHRLWQIWTGFTLINPLEVHLFGCRCSLLPSLTVFFHSVLSCWRVCYNFSSIVFERAVKWTCASVSDISCFPLKFVRIAFLFRFVLSCLLLTRFTRFNFIIATHLPMHE